MVSYPENLKNNVEAVSDGRVQYIRPFIAFTNEKTAADRLVRLCREEWNIPAAQVRKAAHLAWQEQQKAKDDIREEGRRVLAQMDQDGKCGIVLAGRPYHIDPGNQPRNPGTDRFLRPDRVHGGTACPSKRIPAGSCGWWISGSTTPGCIPPPNL